MIKVLTTLLFEESDKGIMISAFLHSKGGGVMGGEGGGGYL